MRTLLLALLFTAFSYGQDLSIVHFNYEWNTQNQFRNLDCIKKTTFDDHIKRHYFFSHESINPTRIIPIGPIIS